MIDLITSDKEGLQNGSYKKSSVLIRNSSDGRRVATRGHNNVAARKIILNLQIYKESQFCQYILYIALGNDMLINFLVYYIKTQNVEFLFRNIS